MYLHSVTLLRFKSFRGPTTVEFARTSTPDEKADESRPHKNRSSMIEGMNILTGPNGHGKSNILDSILFGLTLPISSLRATSLRDLLFEKRDPLPGEPAATVSLVFIDEHDESRCVITSQIVRADRKGDLGVVYRVNGAVRSRKAVREILLNRVHCDVEAPGSFSIMQNTVISVASANSKELGIILAGAAGTRAVLDFVEECEKAMHKWNETKIGLKRDFAQVEQSQHQARAAAKIRDKILELQSKLKIKQEELLQRERVQREARVKAFDEAKAEHEINLKTLQQYLSEASGAVEMQEKNLENDEARTRETKQLLHEAKEALRDHTDRLLARDIHLKIVIEEQATTQSRIGNLESELTQLKLEESETFQEMLVLEKQLASITAEASSVTEVDSQLRKLGDSLNRENSKAKSLAEEIAEKTTMKATLQASLSKLGSSVLPIASRRLEDVRFELQEVEAAIVDPKANLERHRAIIASISDRPLLRRIKRQVSAWSILEIMKPVPGLDESTGRCIAVAAESLARVIICESYREAAIILKIAQEIGERVQIWSLDRLSVPKLSKDSGVGRISQLANSFSLSETMEPTEARFQVVIEKAFGNWLACETESDQTSISALQLGIRVINKESFTVSVPGALIGGATRHTSGAQSAFMSLCLTEAIQGIVQSQEVQVVELRAEESAALLVREHRSQLEELQSKLRRHSAACERSSLSLAETEDEIRSITLERSRLTAIGEELKRGASAGGSADPASIQRLRVVKRQFEACTSRIKKLRQELSSVRTADQRRVAHLAIATPDETLESLRRQIDLSQQDVAAQASILAEKSAAEDRQRIALADAQARESELRQKLALTRQRLADLSENQTPSSELEASSDLKEVAMLKATLKEHIRQAGQNPEVPRAIDSGLQEQQRIEDDMIAVAGAVAELKQGVKLVRGTASAFERSMCITVNNLIQELFRKCFPNIEIVLGNSNDIRDPVVGFENLCFWHRLSETAPYERGLEKLSGGQKTLAGLCLLLAASLASNDETLQLVSASGQTYQLPFILLDEVDAALDEENSAIVAKLLTTVFGSTANRTQVIAISHRKAFQEVASRRISVLKELQSTSSSVTTIEDVVEQ